MRLDGPIHVIANPSPIRILLGQIYRGYFSIGFGLAEITGNLIRVLVTALEPPVGKLSSVVHAHRRIGPAFCLAQGRQHHRCENRDDRYDHQELDERKGDSSLGLAG